MCPLNRDPIEHIMGLLIEKLNMLSYAHNSQPKKQSTHSSPAEVKDNASPALSDQLKKSEFCSHRATGTDPYSGPLPAVTARPDLYEYWIIWNTL